MKKKNNRAEANLRSEHYTNLMLLTVVEAMILLIGQLVIFNAFQIIQTFTPMWTTVTPILFGISLAGTVIAAIPFFMGKKGFMPVCKFFVYLM